MGREVMKDGGGWREDPAHQATAAEALSGHRTLPVQEFTG